MKSELRELLLWLCVAAAAVALFAIAAGFGLAALYIFVAGVLTITLAAVVTAGGALILGGLIAFSAWLANRTSRGSPARRHKRHDAEPNELGAIAATAAARWIRANAKKATFAGLLAGVVAGASPELRQALARLLREFKDSA